MELTCPQCHAKIATGDINVSTDVALCRACGNTFRLSELVGGGVFSGLLPSFGVPSGPVDLNSPPPGAWYEQAADGFTAGATTRGWFALFLVPFTCVWAGGSMYGIYGTQFTRGQFSLGPSLFGIPFLIGSIFLVSWCAMSVAGKVEISVHGDRLAIFTGVGPLGFTRIASLSEFQTAREDWGRFTNNNQPARVIRLEGARTMAFGSMLSVPRRYFLLSALQSALTGSNRSPLFVSR